MRPTTENRIIGPRSRLFLYWTQRSLITVGALAVSYVVITLLYAKFYQEAAGHSLDRQISTEVRLGASQPRTVAKEGDLLGRIEIPRLGLTVAVLEGTTSRTLRLGVGHIRGTAPPGNPGNIGIAGHRDTFFRGLKDIRTGDKIQLQTPTGLSHYEVDWVQIVAPSDTAILSPSTGSAITLVTCYPFHFIGAAPERFAVHAKEIVAE
ncbi:MAG: class D sortase [Terracidiphilus sp.]